MRIMTVRQPWAWAIIHGGKDVENRVRNIAGGYRGPVAIHVAGKYAETGTDLPALHDAMDEWCDAHCLTTGVIPQSHPWFAGVGQIIGVVDLVDVHPVKQSNGMSNVCFDDHTPVGAICSPWAQNYLEFPAHRGYHLVLANPRPLAEPIPYRGALGLRHLDDETVARIEAAIP